jgi:pyruvate kinase
MAIVGETMKKTKVIATIGPATSDKEKIKELILNGMDVARINMSHANQEFLKYVVDTVQELNKELNTFVSTMLDTEGPSVRVEHLEGGFAYLTKGDKIRIYEESILGDHTKFSVRYTKLLENVKGNTTLKINDGLVELFVLEKGPNYLLCEVIEGGRIEEGNRVNIIGINLELPFLSERDRSDILYASKLNVDFVALSFVSTHEDVLEVNDLLIDAEDAHMAILPKIENAYALEDLDEIIKVSDGIIVARGDLGVELPLEKIPGIQKQIINKCHHASKVSIVATEMMTSMEEKTRPTRAEVSDVANAVLEGVDCMLLAGETTVGKYPTESLSMMARIIESAEEDIDYYELLNQAMRTEKQDTTCSLSYSVVECANRLKAAAIVAPTMSGYTAKKISRFRPTCPILAMSPDMETVKSLNIYYGVYPILIENTKSFDKMMELSKHQATKKFILAEGSRIIITGGYPFKEVKHTNFMKIEDL